MNFFFLMQEMNWATAEIVLQGFSCIAIGNRLIRLRILYCNTINVLQVGRA